MRGRGGRGLAGRGRLLRYRLLRCGHMSCNGGVNGNQPSERRHPCKISLSLLKPGSVGVNTGTAPRKAVLHISFPVC